MSNIIREIFVEDHVQQVSTSIKETLRNLYLLRQVSFAGHRSQVAGHRSQVAGHRSLRHARDFKFYMWQAQWRVKIFAFF